MATMMATMPALAYAPFLTLRLPLTTCGVPAWGYIRTADGRGRPHIAPVRGPSVSTITGNVQATRVIELAKNSTGNKFPGVLLDVDDPDMPEELRFTQPAFVEVIFTRPDGVQIRKLGTRPTGPGNMGDDNEISYTNQAGDGINDMYGLWRYTVAAVLENGSRVRSRESVRWWCVRGDDVPVGAGDAPA